MKLLILVGTRPNFIKITRFKEISKRKYPKIKISIVHTGQHYSEQMADVFFNELNLHPDYFLNVTTKSSNEQIDETINKLTDLVSKIGKPDLMLVPGDVNSTLAGALFAKKNNIKLAHLESGLRSFDNDMPEEYNRIKTDELSDLCFISEQSGYDNLIKEGISSKKLYFIGNTMIDTMLHYSDKIDASNILQQLNITSLPFILVTMHRPATVDNKEGLLKLIHILNHLSQKFIVVFPIHPRTLNKINEFNLHTLISENQKIRCTEPLGYFSFQKLIKECAFVITDSGGIQEESTFRRKPCLTLRSNTERPITIEVGTNTLIPFDHNIIMFYIKQIESGSYKKGLIPDKWDGYATERILQIISNL
jgi:UDP-N-acetylglucosamine 2-epimerase (non-hydrolysing)